MPEQMLAVPGFCRVFLRPVRDPATRRSSSRWQRSVRRPLVLLVCLLLLVACPARRSTTYQAEYHLAEHLDSARVIQANRQPLSAPRFVIGFDERRVLTQYAPSAHAFPGVPSGPGVSFHVAPILKPAAWDKPTDGVGFEIKCRAADGSWIQLLELAISPTTDPADRIWHDRQIGLDRCSAPTTEIELRTSCGPRNHCAADWAAWGDPKVIHQQVSSPRVERLAFLISIDTLRPDRLGVYGAERDTSPALERLARDGIVFETAVAPSPWTLPSHASMVTSTYPRVHGADTVTPIAASTPLVSEILNAAGWQTAGFIDSAYLAPNFGFHRGFDHYDNQEPPPGDYRQGAPILRQRLLDWLAAADQRPAFVFWHIMDVHGPYWASAPFGGRFRGTLDAPEAPDPRLERLRKMRYTDHLAPERFSSFDDLVATYDEGVAATDAVLGGLFQVLRDTGLYDQALIVVTSDHGESFLDHDAWVGHGIALTDDEIRVPLIVKLPGNRHAGTRVAEMVGLIDVAPTILDALGVPAAASFQGRSLVSPAPGAAESTPEILYGVSSNTGAPYLRTRRFKYIGPATLDPGQVVKHHLRPREGASLSHNFRFDEQLYDLRRDPRETESLAETEEVEVLEQFRNLVAQHAAESAARREGLPEVRVPELTEAARERLRALGYVE